MSVLILCLPLHHRYQCSDRDSNPDQSLEIRSNTRSLLLLLSEKRGSNPRPPPWQGGALPTELFSHSYFIFKTFVLFSGAGGKRTHLRLPAKHSRQPWYMLPLIVEVTGLEPASFSLQTRRSAN